MRSKVTEWLVSKIADRRPAIATEPTLDDGRDEATVGINKSIESLQEAHNRRPKIDEIVRVLDEHRKANNFGQKIDEVFLQVHKEQTP